MLHWFTSRIVRFQTQLATRETCVCLCLPHPLLNLLCSLCYSIHQYTESRLIVCAAVISVSRGIYTVCGSVSRWYRKL